MDTSLESNRREETQQVDGRLQNHSGFGLKAKKRNKSEATGVHIIRSAGRKDRHSKVCTARGTRDRRVRLAPKTAIQFYDVQDGLGCDRPSKAIDWLMREAKAAIDALDPPDAGNSSNSLNCTVNSQPPENFGFFMNDYSDPSSFAWNYGNSPPPVFGHDQVQFSPLQSRISNYNPIGIEDFAPGEDREIDKIQFSSASLLHYEE